MRRLQILEPRKDRYMPFRESQTTILSRLRYFGEDACARQSNSGLNMLPL